MNSKFNLYIDVTAKISVISLLDDHHQLVQESVVQTENNLVELVNPQLSNLLQENNVSFNQIANIYLNIGPGSFTGVRVGVNVAKTIKSVYPEVNLYVMNSLEIMARGNGIAILDAKGKKWYLAAYRNFSPLLAVQMVTEDQKQALLDQLITAHPDLTIYDEQNANTIQMAQHTYGFLDHFTLVDNDHWLDLEPLYIKDAL